MVKWLSLMVVVASVLVTSLEAAGQPMAPVPAAGTAFPFRRTTSRPEGFTPEMDTFLKELWTTYREADSYRDRGRVRLVQKTGRVTTTTEMPLEFAFQRPNLLALDAGHYKAVCDGTNLYFAMEARREFTVTRAPERLEKSHLAASPAGGGADQGQPDVLDFLGHAAAGDSFVAQLARVAWRAETNLSGVACRVLACETVQGLRLTIWIDAKRVVLLRVEGDTGTSQVGEQFHFVYEPGAVELNEKLDVWNLPSGHPRAFGAASATSTDPWRRRCIRY